MRFEGALSGHQAAPHAQSTGEDMVHTLSHHGSGAQRYRPEQAETVPVKMALFILLCRPSLEQYEYEYESVRL